MLGSILSLFRGMAQAVASLVTWGLLLRGSFRRRTKAKALELEAEVRVGPSGCMSPPPPREPEAEPQDQARPAAQVALEGLGGQEGLVGPAVPADRPEEEES